MTTTRILIMAVAAVGAVAAGAAQAATKTVTLNAISADGVGAAIGTVTFRDTRQGLFVEPKLTALPPGKHGFHVHEKSGCGAAAGPDGRPAAGMAAGGHFDPMHTTKHRGPMSSEGHKGDLPILVVDKDGTASLPGLALHLKAKDLAGHAIMIHAGGDNYDDTPAPLGGGGARIACGVVK